MKHEESRVRNLEIQCGMFRGRKNALADLIGIREFAVPNGGMVDVATIDLKTWLIRGFEIKASRQDFLRDDKWIGYLPYFNFFWFAIPEPGIVLPGDLPEDIGLLVLDQKDRKVPGHIDQGQKVWYLREEKKAKSLQPTFVRRTFGEDRMAKFLVQILRSHRWRGQRIYNVALEAGGQAVAEGIRAAGGGPAEVIDGWRKYLGDQYRYFAGDLDSDI